MTNESRVAELSIQLAKINKEKGSLKARIAELEVEQKQVVRELHSSLGLPVQEAASFVKEKISEEVLKNKVKKVSAAKKAWASKTPEEKERWKRAIQEGKDKAKQRKGGG